MDNHCISLLPGLYLLLFSMKKLTFQSNSPYSLSSDIFKWFVPSVQVRQVPFFFPFCLAALEHHFQAQVYVSPLTKNESNKLQFYKKAF